MLCQINKPMTMESIFMTQDIMIDDDKITYTDFTNNRMPEGVTKHKVANWQTTYNTEVRYRFLKFNNKHVVETSVLNGVTNKRTYYLSKKGVWETRDIPKKYDKYVYETYYFYGR